MHLPIILCAAARPGSTGAAGDRGRRSPPAVPSHQLGRSDDRGRLMGARASALRGLIAGAEREVASEGVHPTSGNRRRISFLDQHHLFFAPKDWSQPQWNVRLSHRGWGRLVWSPLSSPGVLRHPLRTGVRRTVRIIKAGDGESLENFPAPAPLSASARQCRAFRRVSFSPSPRRYFSERFTPVSDV